MRIALPLLALVFLVVVARVAADTSCTAAGDHLGECVGRVAIARQDIAWCEHPDATLDVPAFAACRTAYAVWAQDRGWCENMSNLLYLPHWWITSKSGTEEYGRACETAVASANADPSDCETLGPDTNWGSHSKDACLAHAAITHGLLVCARAGSPAACLVTAGDLQRICGPCRSAPSVAEQAACAELEWREHSPIYGSVRDSRSE